MYIHTLISYLCRCFGIHISTFLMVALAVLAARHLSFAAPAVFVDAATFTGTLEGRERERKRGLCKHSPPETEHMMVTEAACGTWQTEEAAPQLSQWPQQHKPAASSSHWPTGGLSSSTLIRADQLTPVAFVFFDTLRPFSGFSGRHSSSSSLSSSLGDISSSMLMLELCGALAVVKRFPFGFCQWRRQWKKNTGFRQIISEITFWTKL